MRLTEILKPVNIKVPLSASTKVEAITEIIDLLNANGELTDPKKVLDSVLDREAIIDQEVFFVRAPTLVKVEFRAVAAPDIPLASGTMRAFFSR